MYYTNDYEEEPPQAKGGCLRNLLFVFVGFIMLFSSCMFLANRVSVSSSVVPPKNEVKKLITKANHPKLFSSRADVKRFYQGTGTDC